MLAGDWQIPGKQFAKLFYMTNLCSFPLVSDVGHKFPLHLCMRYEIPENVSKIYLPLHFKKNNVSIFFAPIQFRGKIKS